MGRQDAFPRNRSQPLLGICWRYLLPPGTSATTQFFYSYNYNIFSTNIRYRTFRNVFPFLVAYIFADAYSSYRKQILKINLFDEYCYLRSQELVKQNEYMLDHPSSLWLTKASKRLSGGAKISRRLSAKSTGRPTTTQPQITKTANFFCKISSTDTSTPVPLRLWPTSPV